MKKKDKRCCPICGKRMRKDSVKETCYSCYRKTDEYRRENAEKSRRSHQKKRRQEHTLSQVDLM